MKEECRQLDQCARLHDLQPDHPVRTTYYFTNASPLLSAVGISPGQPSFCSFSFKMVKPFLWYSTYLAKHAHPGNLLIDYSGFDSLLKNPFRLQNEVNHMEICNACREVQKLHCATT